MDHPRWPEPEGDSPSVKWPLATGSSLSRRPGPAGAEPTSTSPSTVRTLHLPVGLAASGVTVRRDPPGNLPANHPDRPSRSTLGHWPVGSLPTLRVLRFQLQDPFTRANDGGRHEFVTRRNKEWRLRRHGPALALRVAPPGKGRRSVTREDGGSCFRPWHVTVAHGFPPSGNHNTRQLKELKFKLQLPSPNSADNNADCGA